MTQTTNIGLKKIDGSENWRQIFDYHNDSADKTDSAVAAVQDGLAIVANGNTHAAVAQGQFVYVRNHSTLAEGLYRATAAIGTNATLSTSNLTADGSGGLNALNADVATLNSKINTQVIDVNGSSNTTVNSGFSARRSGNVIVFSGSVTIGNNGIGGSDVVVLTVSDNAKPSINQALRLYATYNNTPGWYTFIIKTDGKIYTATGNSLFTANTLINFSPCVYCI